MRTGGSSRMSPKVQSPHCDVGRGSPKAQGSWLVLTGPDWPEMFRYVLVSGPFRAPPASSVLWSRLNLQ